MSYKAHIESGEKNILGEMRKKLGALKYLGKQLPKSCRKTLATGLLVSRARYLIEISGSTTEKYRKKTQAILNNAARYVSGKGRRVNTMTLMESVGWFSLTELTTYHTMTSMWKLVRLKIPAQIAHKIQIDDDYILSTTNPRLQTTYRSFRWRGIRTWKSAPTLVRECESLPRFKKN